MVKTVLVIECDSRINWFEIFKDEKFFDEEIVIEQAEYEDISLATYSSTGIVLDLKPAAKPHPNTNMNTYRTIANPHFVLVRSVARGIHNQDSRNILYGLMYAGIPSVNSLQSIYMCQERPVVFAELRKIKKQLGADKFPLIEQNYYPNFRAMRITPDYPIVVKCGHAHAGYGKIRCKDSSEFDDVKSLIALHGDYITAEPFIEWDYDIRVQKIGNNYRAFRRVSSNWKGNMGNASVNEDMPISEEFQTWINAASQIFGGLDICAVDALHGKDGKMYILEVNDTAIGLAHRHEFEDWRQIRDLVLQRMILIYHNTETPTNEKLEDKLHRLEDELALTKVNLEREKRLKQELEQNLTGEKKANWFSKILK